VLAPDGPQRLGTVREEERPLLGVAPQQRLLLDLLDELAAVAEGPEYAAMGPSTEPSGSRRSV
jgi:hypothetical protein